MTLCPQCGATVPEDGDVCPECGAALTAEVPEQPDQAEERALPLSPEDDTTQEEAPPERKDTEVKASGEEAEEEPGLDGGGGENEQGPDLPEPEETQVKDEPSPENGSEQKRKARPRDPERGKKILRILGTVMTALGLLLLLTTALTLFQMHRQQKALELAQQSEAGVVRPARPRIINYYARPENSRVRLEGQIRYAADELLVISASDRSYTDMERFFAQQDIRVLGYVELMDAYQIRLPEEHTLYGLGKIAGDLEQEDCIELASLNVLWDCACFALPEDPWGGSADWEKPEAKASNWGVMAIRAPECWERWDLGQVSVGLIDLGFDTRQEELKFAWVHGGDSRSRAAAEEAGNRLHGSAVAAVIGAVPGNGTGLAGAAEDCLIHAVESGGLVGQMDALSAIADLTAQELRPVQLSFGWQEKLLEQIADPHSRARELYYEQTRRFSGLALKRMGEKGWDSLLILPAGNGLSGTGTEAALSSPFAGIEEESVRRHILVVGAAELDEENGLRQCAFSNLGERVDLLAPGAEIYTISPRGGYGRRSGSSLAAAYVTAAAAQVWALNPGLDGGQLRELLVDTADTPVAGSRKKLLNMAAALEEAEAAAGTLPAASEAEAALDAYAALLHEGIDLIGRSGATLRADHYVLTDLDGNGVQELLLYALNEEEQNASFALYGMKDGQLSCLCNAWDTCRFGLWSNMSLTLEIQDGRHIFAEAEKQSTGYGQTGECFWIGYNGRRISCVEFDRRQKDAEHMILIEDSVLTEQGTRIGSAQDLLWSR